MLRIQGNQKPSVFSIPTVSAQLILFVLTHFMGCMYVVYKNTMKECEQFSKKGLQRAQKVLLQVSYGVLLVGWKVF